MKKRLFVIGMLCTLCMAAKAQVSNIDYRPFVEEGKTWSIQVGWTMENEFEYKIEGDTLIDGKSWKKVYNSTFSLGFRHSYYAALREEGEKVYALSKDGSKPRLLYDFGVKEGYLVRCGVEGTSFGCLLEAGEKPDTLLGFPFLTYLYVTGVDTIQHNGQHFRRIMLTMLDSYRNYPVSGDIVWVEGIGSGAGPFSPWMELPEYETFFLNCQDANRHTIFGDFYDIGETNAINSVSTWQNGNTGNYDLQGRRVDAKLVTGGSQLPRGVYIRNGRKFVVR